VLRVQNIRPGQNSYGNETVLLYDCHKVAVGNKAFFTLFILLVRSRAACTGGAGRAPLERVRVAVRGRHSVCGVSACVTALGHAASRVPCVWLRVRGGQMCLVLMVQNYPADLVMLGGTILFFIFGVLPGERGAAPLTRVVCVCVCVRLCVSVCVPVCA
jgi:hypothetical protein